MYLSRTAPGTALVLSGTALVLLAVAPFGWRLGWWPYSFGLYWLMPASGFIGAVAVTLSALTLALGWSELRPRGLGVLSVALCLSAALVYVPCMCLGNTPACAAPFHPFTTSLPTPTIRRYSMPSYRHALLSMRVGSIMTTHNSRSCRR